MCSHISFYCCNAPVNMAIMSAPLISIASITHIAIVRIGESRGDGDIERELDSRRGNKKEVFIRE